MTGASDALRVSDPPRLGLSTDEKIAAARVEMRAWMLATVRPLIGCTCEAHYSTGESAFCERWRQKTAERIADALLSVSGERHAPICQCGRCAFMHTVPLCPSRASSASGDAEAGR